MMRCKLGVLLVAIAAPVLVLSVSPTGAAAKQAPPGPGNSANAKQCQHGGWQYLYTSTGQPFSGEAACTSYAAGGGTLRQARTLTVSKTGVGTGTVTGTGISCGSDCSESYPDGTSVALTATAASGSTFTGWSGACSGTGGCNLTMNAEKTVTASFAIRATCDNGVDDDGDGAIDGADTGCSGPGDNSETDATGPQCDNGSDDDADGKVDFAADGSGDPDCSSPSDSDESSPPPAQADLAFAMASTQDQCCGFQNVYYFMNVENQGPSDAGAPNTVTVEATLPEGLTFDHFPTGYDPYCSYTLATRKVTCTYQGLHEGYVVHFEFVATARPGTCTVTATTFSDLVADPDLTNNSASVTNTIAEIPG